MSEPKLFGNTDAKVWADEFFKLFQDKMVGIEPLDWGTMVGWFANAIESGRIAETKRHVDLQKRIEKMEKALKVFAEMAPSNPAVEVIIKRAREALKGNQ